MPSQRSSSLPVIPVKSKPSKKVGLGDGRYRQFLGLPYEYPHGCFTLVARIFYELRGIDLEPHDEISSISADDPRRLLTVMHERLVTLGKEIDQGQEQEGDVILLRTSKYHVGYVIEPGWMIHAYEGGSACIESYHAPEWRNCVQGFFRFDYDYS